MLQEIEVNMANSTRRVSGELHILQSSVICPRHDFCKIPQSGQIVPQATKILQNF